MSHIDKMIFNEISNIVENEIPNLESRLDQMKKDVAKQEKKLREKKDIVSEACDRYGYSVRLGKIESCEGKYVLEKVLGGEGLKLEESVTPLLQIELTDINSVPTVFYKGEEIKSKINIGIDWTTHTYEQTNPTFLKIDFADPDSKGCSTKTIQHNGLL